MKKRILALLLSIVLVLGLVTVSFAANGTGHKISVKIYKVVLDSSKPLGYQNPELINTITVTCQDSTGHSGYNHSANLKDFYPTNVGAATTDWTGWEFASYYTKGQEQKPFYNWSRDKVNATANVTGSEPYPCSKNFYLVYKDTTPSVDTYTVTYTDGVDGEEVFKDQVYSGLTAGTATPAFAGGTPTRKGYVAQWKDDKNSNGVPDDEETKYTVTYTDGVENEEIFKDQVYEGLLSGEATPKFEGKEPTRKGYVFAGWKPTVAEKVTGNATYVAQWKKLDAAQTGDTMNLTVWYCLLGAAGVCFVAAFVLAKKKQSDK